MSQEAIAYGASIPFDHKLARYDVEGSLAYCRALERANLLTVKESRQIQRGLREIGREIDSGKFAMRIELEDIHMNIEAALTKKIGPVAGKLHTGRSRNDQVATDLRLYCMDQLEHLACALNDLQKTLLDKAASWVDVLMPGYTHLQRAQPVMLSHHLLAYLEMFMRDGQRVEAARRSAAVMPLGSGALAGNPFGIDRRALAKELGFLAVSHNSLDAVADRDFAVECAAAGALISVHLSRLAEELILWSTTEFSFIKLPENYCTGSSMMPQKVNPDIPELIRAKSGRVFGDLMSLLTVLKGLPLAYNKDLQEDKEPLFDLFETLLPTLNVLAAMLQELDIDRARLEEAAQDEAMLATDIADWLVLQKVPFREAHGVVAQLVREAETQGVPLTSLSAKALLRLHSLLTPKVLRELTPKKSVAKRKALGGTARKNILQEIKRHRERLK